MLCDSLVNIYPDPFQSAFQSGRIWALPLPAAEEAAALPSGVVQNNPVVTAAAWTAQVCRGTNHDNEDSWLGPGVAHCEFLESIVEYC